MADKTRKRNQNKKRYNKNLRNKVGGYKGSNVQSRYDGGSQLVVYNPEFVRRQKLLYLHTCVVCRKQDYFLTSCSLCQLAKCCNGGCLSRHCSQDDQRIICARNITFSKAREGIPSRVKEDIFKLGFSEISPHIYSIPRGEVYELMDGLRSVILLQVLSYQIVNNCLQIVVEDIDGLGTTLNLYPPPSGNLLVDILSCDLVGQSFPPGLFILLLNCYWNNHVDVRSAAVEVPGLNCITRLENTEEIMMSIRWNENAAMMRSLQRLFRSN